MSLSEAIEQSEQLIKEGKYDDALSLVRQKLCNKNALYIDKVLFQCGKILMHAGREDEAWIYFNELGYIRKQRENAPFFNETGITNTERIAEVYLWLAEFKYYTDPQLSKRYYDVVTKMRSSSKDKAKISLASRYLLEEKYEITENLIKSVKNSDKNPELLFMLGEIKYKQGKLEEALIPLKKLVNLNPSNIKQVLYFIISIELELGDLEEYIKYTNMMSKVLNPRGYNEASRILEEIEKCINSDSYENIEEYCKKLIDMDIFKYEAHEYLDALSLLRQAKCKDSDALSCYQELINRNICSEIARRKIQVLEKERNKKLEEQRRIYSRIVELVKKCHFKELEEYLKNKKEWLDNFTYRRILSYAEINKSEEKMKKYYNEILHHIKRRHGSDSTIRDTSKFKRSININNLFHRIIEQVDNSEIIFGDFEYYILCDKVIGVDCDTMEETRYVKVSAFMDKKNIITMYPCAPNKDAIQLKGKTNKKTRKNVDKH